MIWQWQGRAHASEHVVVDVEERGTVALDGGWEADNASTKPEVIEHDSYWKQEKLKKKMRDSELHEH